MANRKNTQYWEENKPVYPLCLCYSQEKGLYTKRFTENENSDELLYRPQGYVGFVKEKLAIPGLDLEIEIQSNFGYGSASYLRAIIKKRARSLLDFDLSRMYILNNFGVRVFDVPLYEWTKLFEKIINAYKKSFIEDYTMPSIAYLDELSEMLDKEGICIHGGFEKEKSTEWKGDFLVALFAGNKIRNLLKGFKEAQLSDPIVVKYTLNLCRKYISKVKALSLDFNDFRVSQFSETFMLIHQFMWENDAGIEYLGLLFDKEV